MEALCSNQGLKTQNWFPHGLMVDDIGNWQSQTSPKFQQYWQYPALPYYGSLYCSKYLRNWCDIHNPYQYRLIFKTLVQTHSQWFILTTKLEYKTENILKSSCIMEKGSRYHIYQRLRNTEECWINMERNPNGNRRKWLDDVQLKENHQIHLPEGIFWKEPLVKWKNC